MAIGKLNAGQKRRLTLFGTCVVIAVLAWLFFALSNKYVYPVRTLLNYTELPFKKAVHPLQPDTVTLQVQGSGWQLIFDKLRIDAKTINVQLKSLDTRNYVTFTDQLDYVNSQFESNQKVVSVQPDTLYFDFSERSSKKVPIKLVYNIKFSKQYNISDSIRLTPDYATISGPAADLRKIDYWPTDTFRARDAMNLIAGKVALRKSKQTNISILPGITEVKVPVDEFTEKVIEIPVNVRNTGNRNVKLLPGKIRVTIMTSLSKFAEVDADSFEAVADLNDWRQNTNIKQLPVRLIKSPAFSTLVRLEPQNLDFIIQ